MGYNNTIRLFGIRTLLSFLCTLLLYTLVGISLPLTHASGREPLSVLLLYDSLGNGTSAQGGSEEIQRLLSAAGVKVTTVSVDDYTEGMLQAHSKLILLRNAPDLVLLNKAFIKDMNAFAGDYFHIGADLPARVQTVLSTVTAKMHDTTAKLSINGFYDTSIRAEGILYLTNKGNGTPFGALTAASGLNAPFGVEKDSYAYVPYYQPGSLCQVALGYMLRDWLGLGTSQHTTGTYLVIRDIYPFSDLELVRKLADDLYEAGIPFAITVRPVFHNLDYPAAKRYVETLKYVQLHNGSILVNMPAVTSGTDKYDQALKGQMEAFVHELLANEVVPLGMGAELYWANDRFFSGNVLREYNSVILFPNEKLMYKAKSPSSIPFGSSLYSLSLSQYSQFGTAGRAFFPLDTAITVTYVDDPAALTRLVANLSDRWIVFADYKQQAHTVQTSAHVSSSQHGILTIDGSRIDWGNAVTDVSSDFAYTPGERQQSLRKFFNWENDFFVVVIIATLLVFGFFLIIGYRLYKRKYYK